MKFRFGKTRKGSLRSFSQILPEVTRDLDLDDSLFIESLKGKWRTIAGDIISTHSHPEKVYHGYLHIVTDHQVYSNEIMLMKDHILKIIERQFPGTRLRGIRVVIKGKKRN
jgi:hypothetical protein